MYRRSFLPAALTCLAFLGAFPGLAQAQQPSWINGAVVYCADPEIFSPSGNLAGVTAQLPRLKALGIDTLWLMPVTPRGLPVEGRPNFNSPYCVRDYYGIDPKYGTRADLEKLVKTAHSLGIKVLLDAVLNHTAWDNPLVAKHPEWYAHSDTDKKSIKSITPGGFPYQKWNDVAQLDYSNPELRAYITAMLQWWVTTYDIDGFRFDSADTPYGDKRLIPASFWQSQRPALEAKKKDILMLGECDDPALATTPSELDYAWKLHGLFSTALKNNNTTGVQSAWQDEVNAFPVGTLHLSMQDNWDYPRDVNEFGVDGAKAAAVFQFTINGVPMIYNGMEAMNKVGGVNPHEQIDWSGLATYAPFYQQLSVLRGSHYALQQGAMKWIPNSVSDRVLTYTRAANGEEFLIAINLSDKPAAGSVTLPEGQTWTEMTPGGQTHAAPPKLDLKPKDFAVFQRPCYAQITNQWNGTALNTEKGLQSTEVPASFYSSQWLLVPVNKTGTYFRLQNRWNGKYLHTEKGALTCGDIENVWWSAMWSRESVDGTGTAYRLKNRVNGQYLNLEKGKLQCSPIEPSWTSARWQFSSVP